MTPLPPVLDLFCGCGGMSLGFENAGFTVLEGFDSWKAAVDTYRANRDHPARCVDLSDIEASRAALDEHQNSDGFPIIVGGPPCQDFSPAGSRREGARADLTEKFASLIAHYLPPVFVMENVARAERAAAFSRAVSLVEDAGYTVGRIVLDASRCGVPQTRKRLITVGSVDPGVSRSAVLWMSENMDDTPMTVRDHLGDSLGADTFYRHPRTYARRAIFSVDEPSPTVRGVNRPVPPRYTAHPGDAGPASSSRALTTVERASLQTFPRDYAWRASRTDTEQMIGNAVPVRMAEFIARAVARGVSDQEQRRDCPGDSGFRGIAP